MQHELAKTFTKAMHIDGADLEIRASLASEAVTIDILKSGSCVHRITIADATAPMEHPWIAELFAREDKVELGSIAREVDDYVGSLDIRQG
jgi:hypothetical protein